MTGSHPAYILPHVSNKKSEQQARTRSQQIVEKYMRKHYALYNKFQARHDSRGHV